VLQVAVVYVPLLQSILHTVPLDAADLALCIFFPATLLIVFEFSKLLRPPTTALRN
jgi:hypothetical protein